MHTRTTSRYPTIARIGSVIALVCFVFSTPVLADDYDLHQTIVDPNAPVDVCPNIGGVQVSIPTGMQLDGNGNCYTPTPPAPVTPPTPVTTDLCTNLSGTQTTLPRGYYRTNTGLCYVQPAAPSEPIDVCSNLEDVQIVIPEGYYLDTNNTCAIIPPATDVCPNIDGPQTTIPEGMVVENSTCFTPEIISPGPTTNPPNIASNELKNIPSALVPFVQPLVNLIPQPLQRWLQSLPAIVAQTVPYYIFGIVSLLALGVLLQSIREAQFAHEIGILLGREREIAEQKDTFISLASHYLRTPLTLMEGGIDSILSLKELPPETVQPLIEPLEVLSAKIGGILNDIQENVALRGIDSTAPDISGQPSVFRSPFFWGSVIGSVLLSLFANFLLGVVGDKELGSTNLIFQVIFALAVIVVLYLAIRNLYVQKQLRAEHENLVSHEKTIDEARNVFITQSTIALKESLADIDSVKQAIAAAPSVGFFTNGYERFHAILEKFLLLSLVQTGADRALETINVHQVIDDALLKYSSAIAAKNLTITNNVGQLQIQQNKLLFSFVINSLIENAVKFNELDGFITIDAKPDVGTLAVSISDNGIGIDPTKLGQLFQPFSRATSTMEFNYEGLGFSLFLDKIIMDYTGGSIAAESELKRGTSLTVKTASPLVGQ